MEAGTGPLAAEPTMNAVADLEEGLIMEVALPEPFTGLRIGLFEGPWLMEGFHPPPRSFSRTTLPNSRTAGRE
jgi:hypothetical protein